MNVSGGAPPFTVSPATGSVDSVACLGRRYLTIRSRNSASISSDSENHYYTRKSQLFWDNFYKRHNNKFFKDRHYLEKDWRSYFDDDIESSQRKVVLEVGCGAGNTIFPLISAFPNLYIHACDFSPEAITIVKSHANFNAERMNVFVCDAAKDDLCVNIMPFTVDVVTLIFTLSAVSPCKMASILENCKNILKPNGYILLRDYAVGDCAQVKLHNRNQMISENFYFRGDGTCSFYFSEAFAAALFTRAGFVIVDMNTYCTEIKNHSRNITMQRRWIRAIFGR